MPRLVTPLTALAGALLAVGALTACSAGDAPSAEQQAALNAWVDEVIGTDGGGVGGVMSTDASGDGISQSFPSPATYRSMELRCKGTDRAQFRLRYTGDWGTQVLTQEIVCHDGSFLTPIAIPTDAQELTGFSVDATSPDGQGVWAAVPQR